MGKYVYDWPRPMVTVDAAVFAFVEGRARLLLIQRRCEPFRGRWALPGGFVEMDEDLDPAVARVLAEETGLKDIPLEQLRAFGRPGRDPRGELGGRRKGIGTGGGAGGCRSSGSSTRHSPREALASPPASRLPFSPGPLSPVPGPCC